MTHNRIFRGVFRYFFEDAKCFDGENLKQQGFEQQQQQQYSHIRYHRAPLGRGFAASKSVAIKKIVYLRLFKNIFAGKILLFKFSLLAIKNQDL